MHMQSDETFTIPHKSSPDQTSVFLSAQSHAPDSGFASYTSMFLDTSPLLSDGPIFRGSVLRSLRVRLFGPEAFFAQTNGPPRLIRPPDCSHKGPNIRITPECISANSPFFALTNSLDPREFMLEKGPICERVSMLDCYGVREFLRNPFVL